MSRRADDRGATVVRIRAIVAAAAVTLLLAGCFTPGRTGAPASPASPASGTGQPSASKQTFLLRLIGLCATVDERVQAAGGRPDVAAEQLSGFVQQAVTGQIPDQDRDKFLQFIAAMLEAAARQRDLARATPSPSPPTPRPTPTPAPAPTPKPTPTTPPEQQAVDTAMNKADAAGRAYGMPHLADCPKMVATQEAVWHSRHPAPLAVQQAGSAVVDGAIWVVGGITDAAATDEVWSYDPTLDTWTPGPHLPVPLHHPMAVDYHDELVVLGGFTSNGNELAADTSAEVYRLRDGRWESLPRLLHPRAAGAAAVVGNSIVVVGGRDTQALVRPTEIFDGTSWHDAPAPPVPGDHLAAVTVGTSVDVVGGRALNAAENTAALQQFDPAHQHWTKLRDMPAPRGGLAAVYVDGRIITAGGEGVGTVYGDCDAYDVKAGTWSALASLHTPRHGLVMAAVGPRIFAIGGATRPNHTASTNAVAELDLNTAPSATGSPTARPSPPSPSTGSALGRAGACPTDQESAVRACLTRATARQGRLDIAFTVNVALSTIQDPAHRHLHFFLADPDGQGGTVPDASVMQMTAPKPGSWFNVYSPAVHVLDNSTERGGGKQPLDLHDFSLLCVRVATGAHSLVPDRSGGLRSGNCVTITH